LVALRHAGLDAKRTLVSGPAGFGETTLLSEWLRRLHQSCTWLSLDQDDNAWPRFLAGGTGHTDPRAEMPAVTQAHPHPGAASVPTGVDRFGHNLLSAVLERLSASVHAEGDQTMRSTSRTLLTALCAAGLVAACGQAPQATPLPPQAGLPNPASVFCEGQGGRLDIRQDASGGEIGICVFPDGSECEEWALFRNECQPGWIATQAAAPTSPPVSEPYDTPPEGWEVYTHPTRGYSFLYPAGSTLETEDIDRYLWIVGPLENHEHWPVFGVAHPAEQDYRPPAEADLQAWLVERNRLPGRVVGTRLIAGETAIHTRNDNGPQAYDDDRFYFVHDGQVYEITILHAGKEDWSVYDQFLDSFDF